MNRRAGWGRVSALPPLPAGITYIPKHDEKDTIEIDLGTCGGGVPPGPFNWSYLLPIFCLIFNLFIYVES